MGRECYAKGVGECSGGISREHYISEGVLKEIEDLEVTNTTWAKDAKKVGTESLTAKILCQGHNSQLSYLDAEAIKAFRIFKDFTDKSIKRYKNSKSNIDGKVFELWILKCMCGFISSFPKDAAGEKAEVPFSWLEFLFLKKQLTSPLGLYISALKGDQIHYSDKVGISAIHLKEDQTLAGGILNFRGFEFFLVMTPKLSITPNLMYHLTKIHNKSEIAVNTIHFLYSD